LGLEKDAVDIYFLDQSDYCVVYAEWEKEEKKNIGSVETVEENSAKSDEKWIKLMKHGRKLGCHQMAERSFSINNYQFPVCARCTGVLIGYILTPIVFVTGNYRIYISVILCFIMFIDWYIQYLKIKKSNNMRRLLTGIAGGIGIMSIFIYVVSIIISYLNGLIF
jgi:uncharacterized membrane protein